MQVINKRIYYDVTGKSLTLVSKHADMLMDHLHDKINKHQLCLLKDLLLLLFFFLRKTERLTSDGKRVFDGDNYE